MNYMYYIFAVVYTCIGLIVSGYTFKSASYDTDRGDAIEAAIISFIFWFVVLIYYIMMRPLCMLGYMIAENQLKKEKIKMLAQKEAMLEQKQLQQEINKLDEELNFFDKGK